MQHKAHISLGSNIDPLSFMQAGMGSLSEHLDVLRVSPIYQSPAVGMQAEDFLNAAVLVQTPLPIDAIADVLRQIEDEHGRDRAQPRFSSRTLDLDLLFYGQLISHQDSLSIPRRDILEHAFVLQPLVDISPDFVHPEMQSTLRELLKQMRRDKPEQFQSLRKIDDSLQKYTVPR